MKEFKLELRKRDFFFLNSDAAFHQILKLLPTWTSQKSASEAFRNNKTAPCIRHGGGGIMLWNWQ